MLTKSAESHFGGTRAGIARVLAGKRSVSAVYQWKDVVPLAVARHLAMLSNGELQVDESLYNGYGDIIEQSLRKKRRSY